MLRDTNDVVSSAGVFNGTFLGNTRRVEPRNTPTVINAVFNHRNIWDGRAQAEFNGVDVWGDRNSNAFVYKRTWDGHVAKTSVRIPNASLASQAVGPPLSAFEMSADGRTFQVGRRQARELALRVDEREGAPRYGEEDPRAARWSRSSSRSPTNRVRLERAP